MFLTFDEGLTNVTHILQCTHSTEESIKTGTACIIIPATNVKLSELFMN